MKDIGRNDPCHCGSGRKYKKCCQRQDQLEQESGKKSRTPADLVDADTIPWDVFKLLRQIEDNRAFGLFWQFGHDDGPFRDRYPDKKEFITAVDTGSEVLPAGPSFDLVHMGIDAPDTHLVIRNEDPKPQKVQFQIVTLRPNGLDAEGNERSVDAAGFRIWRYVRDSVDRDQFDEVPSLDVFGIERN